MFQYFNANLRWSDCFILKQTVGQNLCVTSKASFRYKEIFGNQFQREMKCIIRIRSKVIDQFHPSPLRIQKLGHFI